MTAAAADVELTGTMQVINLRTLKPIDRDTIVASVRKTHRLVSTEEGWPQCGIGAEIMAIATEECFDDLDAAPERVTGAEVPMPYAANLEAAALPQVLVPPCHAVLHFLHVCRSFKDSNTLVALMSSQAMPDGLALFAWREKRRGLCCAVDTSPNG